jgi:hypothetical protein
MSNEETWVRLAQLENEQRKMEKIIQKLDRSYKVNTIVYSLIFAGVFIVSGIGFYLFMTMVR